MERAQYDGASIPRIDVDGAPPQQGLFDFLARHPYAPVLIALLII